MKTLTYTEFQSTKLEFMKKHGNDWTVETSPMDESGEYHKTYIFEDGATWIEHSRPTYATTDATVKNIIIPIEVKLLETEAYNSDDPRGIYYYERFNHEKKAEI